MTKAVAAVLALVATLAAFSTNLLNIRTAIYSGLGLGAANLQISDAIVEPIRGYGAWPGVDERWYHVGFVVHKAYDAGLGNCSIKNVSYSAHWADTLIEPGGTSQAITVPRLGTEFPQGFNVRFKSKPTDWRPIRFRVECKGAISNTLEANFKDYIVKAL
jgi:hypothetical protein